MTDSISTLPNDYNEETQRLTLLHSEPTIAPETLRGWAHMLSEGELPDGRPCKEVVVVFPSKEEASRHESALTFARIASAYGNLEEFTIVTPETEFGVAEDFGIDQGGMNNIRE